MAGSSLSTVYPGMLRVIIVLTLLALGDSSRGDELVTAPQLDDPLFIAQWHLKNVGQPGGAPGEDINVEPVWSTYLGSGVRIAIVDDDLDVAHEDLLTNVVPGESFNYVTNTADPTGPPGSKLFHGTAVAGIAGATGFNGIGVRGVAPAANLVGYALLQNLTTINEADAMVRGSPNVHVSNNSWGPSDNFGTFDGSSFNWQTAIMQGVTEGRGGLGTVYLWAAGNGHPADNSNYDGYANYFGVNAIGAVTDKGLKASYSEQGANVLVSTPSGEFCDTHTQTTTDPTGPEGANNGGFNNFALTPDYTNGSYSKCMSGTSGATPVASGVVALMLQANPNLTWRDVRLILAESARQNDPANIDWVTNGAGLHVNHSYGFGVIDARAAVTKAQSWTNVGPLIVQEFSQSPNATIPDPSISAVNGTDELGPTVSDTISVADTGGLTSIEFVDVIFTSNHPYAGDLAITLTSPAGTVSRLSVAHTCHNPQTAQPLNCGPQFASGWRFGSTRHINETQIVGDWTLSVRDGFEADTGAFQAWKLVLYGH